MQIIISIIASLITFLVLDFIWLTKIMKSFYIEKLSSHITVVNGSLTVNYIAAITVYAIAIFSIYFFVIKNVTSLSGAAYTGLIFGFCMYAFYDLTNMATFKNYPLSITIVDILWGSFVIMCASCVMYYFLHR